MNKNKKRLSKLLIPMLALTSINTNAVKHGTHTSRSTSFTKKRSEVNLSSLSKFKPEGLALLKNKLLTKGENKRRKDTIIISGDAYLDVRDKYELIDLNKGRHNYDVEKGLKTNGASGYEGTVTQWRNKETGELCAIKLETKSKLKKNINRVDFYKEYKSGQMGFDKKKWAVRQIDRIHDDKCTYTIQEWINGKTLKEWYKDLQKEPNLAIKIKKIADIMQQINNYLNDVTEQDLIDTDLNDTNIMITANGIMKNVDFSCDKAGKSDMPEIANVIRLDSTFMGALESIDIGNLMTAEQDSDEYMVYNAIKNLLYSFLNSEILNDEGVWVVFPKWSRNKFAYTSENRENFISGLEELAKSLKK